MKKFLINGIEFDLYNKSYTMGILNITPDSFSDGGNYIETEEAIKRLFKVPTIVSLSEAIWNAIDAKAKNIHINFIKNSLGAIQEIKITDDGEGIAFDKFEEYFLQFQK